MTANIWSFAKLKPLILAAALLTAAVAAISSHASMQMRGVYATEDNLLFYMNALNFSQAKELRQFNDQAINYYRGRKGVNEHAIYRLEFRSNNLNEFRAQGAAFHAVAKIFAVSPNLLVQTYPIYLAQTLVSGFFLSFLAVLALVTTVLAVQRRNDLAWGFAAAVVIAGLAGLPPAPYHAFATILVHNTTAETVQHAAELLLRPGEQFSALSFTPRSNLALFLIAVFALRWSGGVTASYVLVGLSSLIHLSSSGLILVMLLLMDSVLRPAIFRRPAFLVVVTVSLAAFFTQENMWGLLGANPSTFAMGAGIAVAVIAATAVLLVLRPALRVKAMRPFAPILTLRERILGLGTVASDLILVAAGWTVTVILIHALKTGTGLFGPLDFYQFWGRVHGRLMMLLWPVVAFGCFSLIAARLAAFGSRGGRRAVMAAAAGLVVAGALSVSLQGIQTFKPAQLMQRLATGYNYAELRLSRGPLTVIRAMTRDEMVLYYAMVRSLDTGVDVVSPILK